MKRDLTLWNVATYMKFSYTYCFYLNNQGQTSALKVAYIFKVFAAQSYFIIMLLRQLNFGVLSI